MGKAYKLLAGGLAVLLLGCLLYRFGERRKFLVVTATAYTSRRIETQGDPFVAAWGDRLGPDVRVVAVSRDLLDMGLGRGDVVRVQGLGEYVVLDKMHGRWRRRIDIYFGRDVRAARKWGRRQVTISWDGSDFGE